MGPDRRTFLKFAAGVAATPSIAGGPASAAEAVPIVDTHIHLFDPTRPQGAPYRGAPTSLTYKTGAFPDVYEKLLRPMGIVGAIAVEASPWIEDNLWLLETCARHGIMVGVVGNLKPEDPEFPSYLERYHKNPLYRGIRYGNLWGYEIAARSKESGFIDGLKLLAEADLVLDSANPNLDLLKALIRVNDAVPNLRIVIDHLPALEPAADATASYEASLKEMHARPNIFCKLSGVIRKVDGKASTELADHKPRLDLLVETFGDDRVMFGSDWPNSDSSTSIDHVVGIVKSYYAGKSREAAEKYFWKNSCRVYKWTPRTPEQPRLP